MKTEDIRHEEFRQLRNEIRGTTRHMLVGIDIAKNKHNAFFGTATGRTLYKRFVFDNTREGFELLEAEADAVMLQNKLIRIVFGMEPTANYHKPLGDYLIRQGYNVDKSVKSPSAALRYNLSHCDVQKVRIIASVLCALHLDRLRIRPFSEFLRDHQRCESGEAPKKWYLKGAVSLFPIIESDNISNSKNSHQELQFRFD